MKATQAAGMARAARDLSDLVGICMKALTVMRTDLYAADR
jgi:hypothetical protein